MPLPFSSQKYPGINWQMKQSAEKISEHILGSVKGLSFILKTNFTRKKARTRRLSALKLLYLGISFFLSQLDINYLEG